MGIFNQHSNNQPHQSFLRGLRGSPGVGFSLTRDGNYDMNNNKLKNVGEGVESSDAVTKHQLEVFMNTKADKTSLTRYVKKNSPEVGADLDMKGFGIKNLKVNPGGDGSATSRKYVARKLGTKANKNDLNDYLKLDGTSQMQGDLNMNNKRITSLPEPQLADEPATKSYVTKSHVNFFNNFLDLQGSAKMLGDLQMNNHRITGLTNPPNTDDEATNKKYVDDNISKSNIKPSHSPKNVFQYLMNDGNEWTTEYGVKVESFPNIAESPHSWDKRVLIITPVKSGRNYRFRLGLQMFRMKTNESYSLIVELYNRDYKTWQRQQTYVNGTGMWVISSNTAKYQHQYGSSGDLYYTKTLIKFKKTSSSPPIFDYYTVHFDDNGGDMNTYPKDFKNQVYIVAYGIEGLTDHVDSEVYDAHEAFEIDKRKMKMLVPLDVNNQRIMNTNFDLKFRDIFKIFECSATFKRSYYIGGVRLVKKNDNQVLSFNFPVGLLTFVLKSDIERKKIDRLTLRFYYLLNYIISYKFLPENVKVSNLTIPEYNFSKNLRIYNQIHYVSLVQEPTLDTRDLILGTFDIDLVITYM